MKQEEKELVLKDLCCRLPYGVIVELDKKFDFNKGTHKLVKELLDLYCVEGIKPYLRPLSSMTKEEREELCQISEEYLDDWSTADSSLLKWKLDAKVSSMTAAFYNSHHLDWNDLISKGLAIEAPEGMYRMHTNKVDILEEAGEL